VGHSAIKTEEGGEKAGGFRTVSRLRAPRIGARVGGKDGGGSRPISGPKWTKSPGSYAR